MATSAVGVPGAAGRRFETTIDVTDLILALRTPGAATEIRLGGNSYGLEACQVGMRHANTCRRCRSEGG